MFWPDITGILNLAVNFLDFMIAFLFSKYPVELLLKVVVFPGLLFIALFVIVLIWFERKFLARMHLRIGPLHVGPIMGLFQPIADFLKIAQKEIIVPDGANKFVYNMAPIVIVTISSLSVAFIPFGPAPSITPIKNWMIYYTPLSLLLILVFMTVRPFVMLGAGWSSNSKYSTIGGLRVAFQWLAYEVPLLIAIAGVVMLAGSFDLIQIVQSQSKLWYILIQPIGFLVFFVSMMAELGRRPFDLPHAEQEIVFGFATEYSGIQFMCFMLAEYIDLIVGAMLVTLLFLGGWLGPAFLPGFVWFLLKTYLVIVIMMMGRGVYPRFRIDQLLKLGWTVLIPLALAQIFIILTIAEIAPGFLLNTFQM